MVKIVIYIIISTTPIIAASCCNGHFGKPINKIDWTKYVSNVKNQNNQNTCWAHSIASYLEIKFAELTGINFKLSVRQIVDNTYKEIYDYNDICREREETNAGGRKECALSYVKARGIMTDRDYMIHDYDIRKITPIGVSTFHMNMYPKTKDELLMHLNNTPVILSIYTDGLSDFNDDIILDNPIDHSVIGTNVCEFNNNLYFEFLNSYSSGWGTCGGYGYIRITDNSDTLVNNRGILYYVSYADIINLRSILSETCSDKIDTIFKLDIGIIVFISVIFTLMMIATCYMVYITAKFVSKQ
jgi:hypothetical protein